MSASPACQDVARTRRLPNSQRVRITPGTFFTSSQQVAKKKKVCTVLYQRVLGQVVPARNNQDYHNPPYDDVYRWTHRKDATCRATSTKFDIFDMGLLAWPITLR
jgi:hypothetical protein